MSDVLTVGELLAEFMAERVGQTFSEPGIFWGRTRAVLRPSLPIRWLRPGSRRLISCLAQGIDLKRTLTLANAAGALAVTKRRPMEGNTTLSELELFIASAEIRK